MIKGIPKAQLKSRAAYLKPFLERIAQAPYSEHEIDDLWRMLFAGHMQAWDIDGKAIALTSVRRNYVWIEELTGDDHMEWDEEFDTALRDWARALGKSKVRGLFRKGWWRRGKKRGWTVLKEQYLAEVEV